MKRVAGISLGSSERDETSRVEIFGTEFEISRIGTDGDPRRFAELLRELDGKVDAFGMGGTDRYLWVGNRRYTIRESEALARNARITPIVDGSGVKNTLERETIRYLQDEGIVDFRSSRVLVVVAVDRFGMAEALSKVAKEIIYGDLIFSVGVGIPIRSYRTVRILGTLLLPIIVRLPFKWFYPTGSRETVITPKWHKYYGWADVIAGDFHFIRRYLPPPESGLLEGKVIITNTVTREDSKLLGERGVRLLVTPSPSYGGRHYATNVLEAVLISLLGKRPEELTADDYTGLLRKMQWRPTVVELQRASP